jgi:hypothetical protein
MRLRVLVESTGTMVEVDVLPQLMVLAVKEIMALHTAIPVACQQLWWRTVRLDDASVLKNVLPPMFFHASLDTVTPEYYRLLGDIDDRRGGDVDDLQDLERVRKEAFLTLKVVNPSTLSSASSVTAVSVRNAHNGSSVSSGNGPISLRHTYLRAAERDHDPAAYDVELAFHDLAGGDAERHALDQHRHEQHRHPLERGRAGEGGYGAYRTGGGGDGGSGNSVSNGSRGGAPSFEHPVTRWTARETAAWLASLGSAYQA